jgi:AraC-like DNA-binding protein
MMPVPEEAAMSEVTETADIDLIEHALNDSYGRMRIDARGERRGMRLSTAALGPVRLDELDFRMSLHADIAPRRTTFIVQLTAGKARYISTDGDRRYGQGDLFVTGHHEMAYDVTVEQARIEIAILPPALLSQVADIEPRAVTRPVRITGADPVSAAAVRTWETTSAYVRGIALAADAGVQPLLIATATQLLAAAALTVFPNNAYTDPTIEDRHDAHPATLRRAIAFIEEHADQDIGVADIAEAAFVTIRAVQLAFRRHLDMTPLDYVRRVRLDRAHRELMDGTPLTDSVTAVAYRWGFPNPSRFAAYYRQAYGVLPRETLQS